MTTGRKTAKAGDPLAFSATASDADGDHLDYAWTFGDGSTGAGALTEHAYAAGGTYTAVVTVTDGAETVTRSVTVTVKGKLAR